MLGCRQLIVWQRRALQTLLSVLIINFASSERKFDLLSLQSERNEILTRSCISIKERRKWIGAGLQMEPQPLNAVQPGWTLASLTGELGRQERLRGLEN